MQLPSIKTASLQVMVKTSKFKNRSPCHRLEQMWLVTPKRLGMPIQSKAYRFKIRTWVRCAWLIIDLCMRVCVRSARLFVTSINAWGEGDIVSFLRERLQSLGAVKLYVYVRSPWHKMYISFAIYGSGPLSHASDVSTEPMQLMPHSCVLFAS